MRRIAIMNLKGGVGKTITALNLADILSRAGKRVVLVDCDGQASLTRFCLPHMDAGADPVTVADVLCGDCEPLWSDNTLQVDKEGLVQLLPASSALYELDVAAVQGGGQRLSALVDFAAAAAGDGVDFMIFDCPPGFTVASMAALSAAQEVVIPMLVDGFSTWGVRDLAAQLDGMRQAGGSVRVAGVLITQWHSADVVRQGEALIRSLGVPVFRTAIRRTDKVPESTWMWQALSEYSPRSSAARDYRYWVQEYLGEEVAV